ncbi:MULTISPECIES: ATP phosphoribosyltransferase regulatory subunit [unclassified Moraxella]|uniref:ATP phosphoribosyltransferase regulatory subunit n=1 Tax=unclassified Moraxella TaxID=2685852 RepID=UPI003AF4C86B
MSISPSPISFATAQNNWLLPDGITDLMSPEAVKQEALRYRLTRILMSHGYELISPPMIEYTESLLGYASEDVKRQTFKIIDQLTGRLMGVRADITPQIARIDAHVSEPNQIARYCYAGHVIYTLPKGLFGSRTPLQLGAEIFGADSINSDIELLDVLFTLLDSTDLVERSHIDIGHVAIFNTLCELAELPVSLQQQLIDLYTNKALPELKTLTTQMASDCAFAQDFYVLGEAGNDLAKLQQQLSDNAKQNPQIAQALQDLTQLVSHLRTQWHANVSVDVTGLGYHYHTGMVFNVYVANEPLPIIRGGRFSNQHQQANVGDDYHARSAVGFSCELNRWQNYIPVPVKTLTLVPFDTVQSVLADPQHPEHDSLTQTINTFRQEGQAVVIALSAQDKPKHLTHQLTLQQGQWVQVPL